MNREAWWFAPIGIVVMAMIVLAMVGCAATPMSHPTKVDMDKDNYECKIVAERRASAWGGGGDFGLNPFLYKDFIIECLESRGWSKT